MNLKKVIVAFFVISNLTCQGQIDSISNQEQTINNEFGDPSRFDFDIEQDSTSLTNSQLIRDSISLRNFHIENSYQNEKLYKNNFKPINLHLNYYYKAYPLERFYNHGMYPGTMKRPYIFPLDIRDQYIVIPKNKKQ